jgi:putative Holliday junction resolvase
MRYLGIDYGTKNVGLAISDESGRFAFPYRVLANDKNLIRQLELICQKEGIAEIVVGNSLNYQQQANELMFEAKAVAEQLKNATKLPLNFENEILTTAAANRDIGPNDETDARAAAIILATYLDRH